MSGHPVLYYIHDPMCSWCWGFKPCWDQLRERLRGKVEIRYVVGGLATETQQPMPQAMRDTLQQTWRRVTEVTGAQFNHEFWSRNTPMRSTYPACKAELLARDAGLELEMVEAIQRLYYQQAGNPSDYEQLYALAAQLGMDEQSFRQAIHSEALNQRLLGEIMYAESLGARGFPSLVLEVDGYGHFIEHSYTDVETNLQRIEHYL